MSKPVFEDLFSFEGRRNRKSYLLATLTILAALLVVWGVFIGIAAASSWAALAIPIILTIPVVVMAWAIGSQRCRDFGWTGWAILITLLPYVGWIFSLAILFIPGTQGPNRYGPDPLGNDVT